MTEYIVRDGETGRALVASTGTPVDEILQAIDDGAQFEAVLARHPELTPQAIRAALRFARNAVDREHRPAPNPPFGESMVRERFNGGSATGGIAEAEDGLDASYAWTSTPSGHRSIDDSIRAAAEARERLLYELDIVESIHAGLEDVAAGRVISHEDAVAFLREKIPG
jgi:uncharacterized protein (DUF433 family)/predicted transcriptional regulator